MQSFQIHTVYSPWYALLCLAVGVGVAWFLYRKSGPWPTWLRWLLATLRAALVALICFLLLQPYTRHLRQEEIKPTVVLALDNSQSVKLFTPPAQLTQILTAVDNLAQSLRQKGMRVEVQTHGQTDSAQTTLAKNNFTVTTSNLHALLSKGASSYRNQNLAAIVLLSDGIHNQGPTPTFQNYNTTIYPVALGDTIPKRDVVLEEIQYNKINYSGTSFPMVAQLRHFGLAGSQVNVQLLENGKPIQTKRITLPARAQIEVPFQIAANAPSKKHYEVVAQPLEKEFTHLNNRRHAYLEIVKGKLNILLASAAPHPDIKAIRSALQANPLLNVEIAIGPFQSPAFKAPYDAAILHQIPNTSGTGSEWLRKLRGANVPSFYILGAQTDFPAFNALQAGVALARPSIQYDEVQPVLSSSFQRFAAEPIAQNRISAWPPVPVTFGEWTLAPSTEVILHQQVGTVKSSKPLLVYKPSAPSPAAVLLTDGSWQWRLSEAADHGTAQIYDDLVTHLVQLLANRKNQKRLHVFPVKDEFEVSENVAFQTNVYNAVQEEIYGQTITLTLTDEKGKNTQHRFRHEQGGEGLRLGTLPGGVYRYRASTRADNQTYTDAGEFVVQEQNLEALMALADHELLNQLAQRSETRLFYPSQIDSLEQALLQANYKTILRQHQEEKDLLEQPWFFLLLLALACTEWGLRRFYGAL